MKNRTLFGHKFLLLLTIPLLFCSCSDDDKEPTPDPVTVVNPAPDPNPCSGTQTPTFAENNSIIVIEAESNLIPSDKWSYVSTLSGFTGSGYIVGKNDSFGVPGAGTIPYKVTIENAGTYRFIWRSRITEGTSFTDFNDSWLRIADADDFYGQGFEKDTTIPSTVYPVGTGKTPNPEGASADGWFKIYMNTVGSWHWQASTFDHNPHKIYAQFDNPGTYTVEISARSKGHGIDKFILFQETSYTEAEAIAIVTESAVSCN